MAVSVDIDSLVSSSFILNFEFWMRRSQPCFDEPVAPGITQRVALAEAAIVGQSIGEYAPCSKGHEEFRALARFTERALGGRL